MYQNVLNDIKQEQAEAQAEAQNETCESGICDLKQSRIVDDVAAAPPAPR